MINRRELLQKGATVAAGTLALTQSAAAWAKSPSVDGMNIVLFISDQERAIQHFPRGWAHHNLPGFTRLQRNGLTFENAFCSACMCSPTRATMMTGYFPAQHGVKYTLETDMPPDKYPQVELPHHFKNMASVMGAAGYNVVYKGKWHLSKPAHQDWAPSDLRKYGFNRWNPPDAGADQSIPEEGGGTTDNDGRYMNSQGSVPSGDEGVLQYINSVAAKHQPFFLIVSLINPHDVLEYPSKLQDAGYDDSWLTGDIGLPGSVDDSLATKPSAQRQFRRIMALSGRLKTDEEKRNYLNFYGNLMKLMDSYLVNVLDALKAQHLLDNTLMIRTSDHGEMGLAHGGLRQKCFNVYEETMRVPLVYSNPRLWHKPETSKVMVSHVDLLPTLASLVKAPAHARAKWQGVDYSDHVMHRTAPPPQDYVVFTFDDWQAGQGSPPYVKPPQHIISLRERRWKIAEYYDPKGRVRSQWEMYDLRRDPQERHNLAHRGHHRTPLQEKEYRRLRRKLARVKHERLRPLPDTPQPETTGRPNVRSPISSLD